MSKILVVDDEKSIRKTFEIILKKEKYDVFLAEDVPAALKIIDDHEIDLIFTDIIMPRYTGMDMLNMLKENYSQIPVIIMTGEPTVETAKIAVKDLAFDYLTKPVSKNTLIKLAKHAIKQKKLSDERNRIESENEEYRKILENQVEKRTKSLQEAVNGTISTIAKILETKDPYTAGHEKKVANISLRIAGKMNLTKDQKDCIFLSGYLHDIGKLLLPAEILFKPGKLSESEFRLIKEHVVMGVELVEDIQLPWDIGKVILQHHERIDGSGYPKGLCGDDLSVESKILAVADVVEALSSQRPYRPGFSVETALSELKKNSGILYDDDVVTATISLFEDEGYDIESDKPIYRIEI